MESRNIGMGKFLSTPAIVTNNIFARELYLNFQESSHRRKIEDGLVFILKLKFNICHESNRHF